MTDLMRLGAKLVKEGPCKQEITPRRVRVLYNRQYIVDTTKARHVWEHPYFPQYYLPVGDFRGVEFEKATDVDGSGSAYLAGFNVGGKKTESSLIFEKGALDGLVRLNFDDMDAWFEEEEQIYVHPKDPYKRVDILRSSRHIRVEIAGKTIAESSQGMFLHETGLPVRYYLPSTSLKWELTRLSGTTTRCPYKGMANYYDVIIDGKEYKDIVWWYKNPTLESIAITGMVCFYNEKVDIWIDGKKEDRPKSKFG